MFFFKAARLCLPGLAGLFQVGDAVSSKRRGYTVHFYSDNLYNYLQELSSQHWGLHRPAWWSPVLWFSHAAEIKDHVFKREHCNLAPTYLLTATMAEDAEMRTLFPQMHGLRLPSQKVSRGRMTKLLTWNLHGEYTSFSLCCNTYRQSQAKDNTCAQISSMHLCVCADVHIHMNSDQLLSCSSLGKSVPSQLNVYNLLRSYQHETFFISCTCKKPRT